MPDVDVKITSNVKYCYQKSKSYTKMHANKAKKIKHPSRLENPQWLVIGKKYQYKGNWGGVIISFRRG